MEQKTLSDQEIFDKMVGGVLKQGRPAMNAGGDCTLLDAEGNRCAGAQLIPKELILEPNLAPIPALVLLADRIGLPPITRNGRPESQAFTATGRLIEAVRAAHDGAAEIYQPSRHATQAPIFMARFTELCRQIAEDTGLSAAVIDAHEAARTTA